MNPTERLNIWTGIADRNRAELANADAQYPCAAPALLAKIKANILDSIRMAEGFVKFYTERLAA